MIGSRYSLSAGRRRVLIVGEDDLIRAFTADALAATGDVVEARDTASALDVLASPGRSIDLVIVDCPSSSERRRLACVRFVHAVFLRWPWIPVVIISAAEHTERLVAGVLVSGVREILGRPLNAVDLGDSIRRAAPTPGSRALRAHATIVKIKRILAFLGEDVEEIPNLGALAEMAMVSRSHFSHVFRAVAGMPLRGYVQRLRLKRAHELLTTSKRSVTAVAHESGYYDLPHFDKAFRRRFGMSPQRYRTLYGRWPATSPS